MGEVAALIEHHGGEEVVATPLRRALPKLGRGSRDSKAADGALSELFEYKPDSVGQHTLPVTFIHADQLWTGFCCLIGQGRKADLTGWAFGAQVFFGKVQVIRMAGDQITWKDKLFGTAIGQGQTDRMPVFPEAGTHVPGAQFVDAVPVFVEAVVVSQQFLRGQQVGDIFAGFKTKQPAMDYVFADQLKLSLRNAKMP